MTFKTKADSCFDRQLQALLLKETYIHDFAASVDFEADMEDPELLSEDEILVTSLPLDWRFDFEACEKLFLRYGYYLELINADIVLSQPEVKTRLDAQ